MEHEVFVPYPVGTVRRALSDPARVARSIPGLHRDPDASADDAIAGRLRIRVGGSTITYRGVLRVAGHEGVFTAEGEGTEARGNGSARISLTIVPKPAEGGTLLVCSGTAHSEGRLSEAGAESVDAVARRLLDRFGTGLTADLEAHPEAVAGESASLFDADVPPPSLDPRVGEVVEGVDGFDGFEETGEEPPAEAAHARRTMIGRSTEEVDHAPPRGRYAPVPAPEAAPASLALRWAAPAAALVLASAVVVGRRVLRRRR
ncbi:carbon monoxide dehydrogenase subunit G [Streptomyces sp. LX-29]|uniref:SRPBCC family protein n=1 Tax=Streptomyces sp. LX-29 TaxID=2900152 RepID=UPI00240E4F9B|nr:SRPBCC family protein [Streptomyces sp. LX-29]WFB08646.1 carbon monoxide dehydrogenase subunit G [Streptomyces sp. LX-29]